MASSIKKCFYLSTGQGSYSCINKETKAHLFFLIYSSLQTIYFNPVLSSSKRNVFNSYFHSLTTMSLIYSLFFPSASEQSNCVKCLSLTVWLMKITASRTKSHYCCWTRVLLCLFRTLVMPTNTPSACVISRLWVIVSVYVFWSGGGARVNGDSLLPIKWLCLACRPPHWAGVWFPPTPSLSPSQEHLCGWVDRSCACTHAGNCKHICINTHSSFLLCHQADSNIHIGAPCSRRRCCSLLISYLRLCRQGSFFLNSVK